MMLKIIILICVVVISTAIFFDEIYPKVSRENIGSVDKILVQKKQRILSLFNKGRLIKSYPISLGRVPTGHKKEEGDGKTPVGTYLVDWVHPDSSYHKAVRISYPNSEDNKYAMKEGVVSGGDIMIHGMPNGLGWLYPIFIKTDWTEGCIAVSNTAMEEIESSVKIGTKIIIEP